MGHESPTIKDVAEASGVSVATVSRILNGQTGYREDTRLRVMKEIDRLSYRRNAIARGLVSKKTHTLGVLLPSVTSRFASELLAGLEGEAHKRGYSVITCNTDRNGYRTTEYLRVLSEKQVDGLVFTSEYLTEEYGNLVEDMGIPVVLLATMSMQYPIPYVKVDDRQASYTATQYLIRKGHSHIGMVSGTKADPVAGVPRVNGFLQAMDDAKLKSDESNVAYGDFHFASGQTAAQELLGKNPNLTAIFAASDEMALGVISAAWDMGIAVPESLSVIGYDDTLDAMMSIPPLTTLHQPIIEMGAAAVKMLLDGSSESRIFPSSITERRSVKEL